MLFSLSRHLALQADCLFLWPADCGIVLHNRPTQPNRIDGNVPQPHPIRSVVRRWHSSVAERKAKTNASFTFVPAFSSHHPILPKYSESLSPLLFSIRSALVTEPNSATDAKSLAYSHPTLLPHVSVAHHLFLLSFPPFLSSFLDVSLLPHKICAFWSLCKPFHFHSCVTLTARRRCILEGTFCSIVVRLEPPSSPVPHSL